MVRSKVKSKADKAYLDDVSIKSLADRLSRIEGHVRSVKKMVNDRRCANDILLQVAAIKAAMNKFAAVLIEHELNVCINSCMPGEAQERLDKVTGVLATLLKQS